MTERFTLGGTARLTLDLITAGVGTAGKTPTAAVRRISDGRWYKASDTSWQVAFFENPMVESHAANLPGVYHFNFNQAKDLVENSTEYTVKLSNAASPAVLEYRNIAFGPMPAVTDPDLCSIHGTVFSLFGIPVSGALVMATLYAPHSDRLGRSVGGAAVSEIYTGADGAFDIPLVRGAVVRLQISDVGYDKKITVPDLASVLFTTL